MHTLKLLAILAAVCAAIAVANIALLRPPPDAFSPRPACKPVNFNYGEFVSEISRAKTESGAYIAGLAQNPEFEDERLRFHVAKMQSLDALKALVDRYVAKYGTQYPCISEGYWFLMKELYYPTFESRDCRASIDGLELRIQRAERPLFLDWASVFLGPATTLICGILSYRVGRSRTT